MNQREVTVTIDEPKREMVNHPSHYGGKDNPYEAIKYIARAGKKDAKIQELKKALWYLQREIQKLEDVQKAY